MKWSLFKFTRKRKPVRKPIRRTILNLEELEDRRLFSTNITQYHVDSQSTGANLTETQLTPSNVNAADFGQLYNTSLDGQVYAEPLVLTNVAIKAGPNTVGTPGTYASVVFVATQHDSLYAINSANGAILWQRTFLDTTNPNDYLPGATSVTTIPSGDTNSADINPEVGITGTPVIDPSDNIIYLIPNTKEIVGGQAYYVQRLHAINVSDGTDAVPAFVIGTTTGSDENTNNTPIYVNGTGDGNVNGVVQFNALRQNNRPALSLVNGEVYAEWSSHGDNGPYHGWVVRWDVTNLSTQGMVLSGVLCTDPNGGLGGIWGGGGGLTFDPSETFNGQPAFYFETGNGATRGGDPPLDANGFPADDSYYESLLKVEADPTTTAANQNSNGWGLRIVDYFTPYNVNALDEADEDFGSGSPLVLPDSAGIPGHPHLIVAAGKEGKIYVLDRDNLGKFHHNDDAVLNSVYDPNIGVTTPPVLINGSLSTPAYYHGTLYWVSGYNSNAWSYIVAPNPAPNPPNVPVATLEPTSETANSDFGYLPGSVMISANGSEDPAGGIVWIMDLNNNELHAYSSLSLSTELWNSGPGSIAGVKFAVPTVANGQVFVGTHNSLQVFGITGPSTPAQPPNAPANLSAQALSGSAIELNWTDSTVSPNFATNYAIQQSTDGVNFTTVANASQESTSYTVTGLNQNTTYYFQIVGSNSAGSSGPSNIANATTTNQTGQTPTAPQGLGATPASGSEVYLTWTNTATNETGFVLTRATDSLFTQNVVTQTLASAPYYYTDGAAGLSPGHTYYYRLQAINSAGLSSTSNTASVNIPNVPSAPTNATAVPSGNNIVVSWTDHAGPFALGYQIERSVDGGPYAIYADRPETSDSPPSTQTYTDTNTPFGHTYSYEIVAENVSGFSAPAYATAAPGVMAAFSITGFPSPAIAGTAGTFTVMATDAYGNRVPSYIGTIHFTSSDPLAVLPPDYTFSAGDQGQHMFTATLATAGAQSITATDTTTGTFTGSETGIIVYTPPTVTTNPTDQTAAAGQTATFTAAANGYPAPTVQWQVSTDGGLTFTDLSGATNTTLTLTNLLPSQSGSEYRAVFTNSAGSVTTSAATLAVQYAPIVTINPSNQAVIEGQTTTFSAAANANPSASVQWQVSTDGGNTFNDISGATSAVLTLSNVPFYANGYEYRAVFTNSQGATLTNAATLTVYTPPSLTANPSNQTVTAGNTATFTASATGNPAPTVQWQVSFDGGTTFGNISGATSTTLTISNIQAYQNGYQYQAVFTNAAGTAVTSAATLNVPYAPTVTINPGNQTVTAGQTATLTAAASGNPTPTVQWQVSTDGGNTFTDISGATSPTLTLNNVQLSQNGYEYQAIFTNTLGSAATNVITLTVLSAPTVTTNPSNETVTAGQKATFSAAATGNPTPTVQWQVSTDGGKTFTDISGAISRTLTLVGTTTAMSGNQYQAIFTNSNGTATTSAATLTVTAAVAPVITGNPVSQTVSVGASVSFTAAASGSPTPNVQWQVSTDGGNTFSNIFGATGTTLRLTGVTAAMSGYEYQAVFSNSAGSATSFAAQLVVSSSSSSQAAGLSVPPLLALIDQFLGGIESVSADGTKTITYRLFGFSLIVANYGASGNFVNATLFGISVPNWVWFV